MIPKVIIPREPCQRKKKGACPREWDLFRQVVSTILAFHIWNNPRYTDTSHVPTSHEAIHRHCTEGDIRTKMLGRCAV